MSYKSKSALAALTALVVVYGAYFLWACVPGRPAPVVLVHMVGAAIGLVLILTALEIAIAIGNRKALQSAKWTDERDNSNGLRSARNGYYVLAGLIWTAPFIALAGAPPVLLANLCLGMLVAAEAVQFGSRVVYDRLGA